jgi:hypothetical protein
MTRADAPRCGVTHGAGTNGRSVWYYGVCASTAGDSSDAPNGIDSVIPPAGQLSPGSVGGLRSIEGIVR